MKNSFLILLSLLIPIVSYGQDSMILYTSSSDSLFRIPAIATGSKGEVIALADYRHLHGDDVGFGKPLDIMRRISLDNGKTWGRAGKAVACDGQSYSEDIFGFGDPAIVTDRQTGETVILCVGDREAKGYWQRGRLEVHRLVSRDGGLTWGEHSDLTDQIYSLGKDWKCLFIGSGKIFQSRRVKVGNYYRLYCSALVADFGNAVLYSDDFGAKWNILGGDASPCPDGDEPKVEELPDGSVILSSRTNGRYFNIFHYDGKCFSSGHWTGVSKSESIVTEANSTNGEILGLKVKDSKSGKKKWLYLQSVPAGPGRSHVSVYYKVLPNQKSYRTMTSSDFGKGWSLYQVTEKESAYSTMSLQADGRIGFLYERKGEDVNGYDIVYTSLSVEDMTSGSYRLARQR